MLAREARALFGKGGAGSDPVACQRLLGQRALGEEAQEMRQPFQLLTQEVDPLQGARGDAGPGHGPGQRLAEFAVDDPRHAGQMRRLGHGGMKGRGKPAVGQGGGGSHGFVRQVIKQHHSGPTTFSIQARNPCVVKGFVR